MKPNQVLHFNFLYIAPKTDSSLNYQWLFVIRDDFSGMVLLTPVLVPNTHATVDALLEWRAVFGRSDVYVSDQASYFLSETMKELVAKIGAKQHFVTAYAHYSNGTIEIVNRQILNLMKCLISELRYIIRLIGHH